MEEIKRPDNVTVPRSLQRKIEARRALQEGTVEDMRATLRSFGETVGNNVSKDALVSKLYGYTSGGNAINVPPEASATASASDPAAATVKKGGE